MPDILFVCLQDEDKIASFAIGAGTGELTREADMSVAGGPSVLALSPDRQILYVGQRAPAAISSFRIDQRTGALNLQGSVEAADAPTFLAPDPTGRYLLSAYYRVDMPPCTRSDRMARSGRRCSTGKTQQSARTRSRPIRRTALLLSRTSHACRTMFSNRRRTSRALISSRNSGSMRKRAI